MSKKVLIDSSVWIEIFSKGPKYSKCNLEMRDVEVCPVPAIIHFEVYQRICSKSSSDLALSTSAWLRQYGTLDLTDEIAMSAAEIALENKLGMADSIVLAHAIDQRALLVTLDNDFSGIKSAKVIR